ncbi:MAG: hypothetical protein ABIG44_09495 [Planctomycetota bacterium]
MEILAAIGLTLAFGKWYYITMVGLLVVMIIIYKVVKGRGG